MSSLYNIGNELLNHIEEIQNLIDDGADVNSNEIQERLQEMVGTEENWKAKAVGVAKYIKYMDAQEKIIKDEAKLLAEKAKKFSQRADYLRQTLIMQMETFGVESIPDPILSIKLQNNPWSVVVSDEENLPDEYKRTKVVVEVDKKALLASKPEIENVSYIQTKRLVFK